MRHENYERFVKNPRTVLSSQGQQARRIIIIVTFARCGMRFLTSFALKYINYHFFRPSLCTLLVDAGDWRGFFSHIIFPTLSKNLFNRDNISSSRQLIIDSYYKRKNIHSLSFAKASNKRDKRETKINCALKSKFSFKETFERSCKFLTNHCQFILHWHKSSNHVLLN